MATLYTFGLKRGVGLETLSEFFVRLRLQPHLGCSPPALRGVMPALEQRVGETAQAWEQEGTSTGEGRDIIGAVDATFLEHLRLVFLELPSGSLLVEEVAAERTYATWKAVVDERLKPLRATLLSLVSDRANAWMQLAETGFECLSMPAFFPCLQDMVKSYALALGRRLRHAPPEWIHVETLLTRRVDRAPGRQDNEERAVLVAVRRAEVQRWTEGQRTYPNPLETLSLTRHPFGLSDSAPQTSTQGASRLQAEVEAIATVAARPQWPACHAVTAKVRTPLPALAALGDFWGAGVEQDLEHAGLSTPGRTGAREYRRPLGYGEYQAAQTRWARSKARLRKAAAASQTAFDIHMLPQRLPRQALEEWQAWATPRVRAFQRTSAAGKGRNGSLAQRPHNQRGFPPKRHQVWPGLHNFDCCALDGTTPAPRFFGRGFPDLFETVLPYMAALPRPRQRKHEVGRRGG